MEKEKLGGQRIGRKGKEHLYHINADGFSNSGSDSAYEWMFLEIQQGTLLVYCEHYRMLILLFSTCVLYDYRGHADGFL